MAQSPAGVEIQLRWWTQAAAVAAVLAVFWNAFVGLLWLPALVREGASVLVWVLGAVFALAGAVLGYIALAGLCNRTRIGIEAERVVIRSGPIPCGRGREFARSDILHVYARRREGERHAAHGEVWLVLREHAPANLRLVDLLPDEAQFLALELSRALKLPEHGLRQDPGALR